MPSERVLVIDDEEAIRRFLRVALSSQGYKVIEQDSGKGGISTVATEKPDVLILDLGLVDPVEKSLPAFEMERGDLDTKLAFVSKFPEGIHGFPQSIRAELDLIVHGELSPAVPRHVDLNSTH